MLHALNLNLELQQPDPEVEQSSSPPPAKRARLCSHCSQVIPKLSMEKLHAPNFYRSNSIEFYSSVSVNSY